MTPQTFLIKSDNPYLLKALVEDLVKEGYKATWGRSYQECTYICSNAHACTGIHTVPDWKLYMDKRHNSKFHKTFTLPQDYQQAFKFAVEQLQVVNDIIKVEEKTGHLMSGEVYWSNNEIYHKGFIWRFKDIESSEYITNHSVLEIDKEIFNKNRGLNDRAWQNIRKATLDEVEWLEACEKADTYIPEEDTIKPKFKVGKWYEINYPCIDKKFIVKAPNNWMCTNNIENKVYYPEGAFPNDKIILREMPIEEIQQYLPDGHEDKIIKYTLEEGEYYKVVEDDYWMIGRVSKGNNGNNDGLLLRGDCSYSIDSNGDYDVDEDWCYYDEEDGRVVRNFTKLSKDSDEVMWLEACYNAGEYLTKEEALKPKSTIKVGDIVVVTKQESGNYASIGSIVKVIMIDNSGVPYKTEDCFNLYNWTLHNSWCIDVRLATQEEINEALLNEAKRRYPIGTHFKSAYKPNYPRTYTVEKDYYSWYRDGNIVVNHKMGPSIYYNGNWAEIVESKPEIRTAKFGEVTFTIEGNNDYATTKYGKVTKGLIEKAVDYLKNPPTLAGFKLTIHTENGYEKISNVNKLFKIGFGCQSGTLQELENILKCFS